MNHFPFYQFREGGQSHLRLSSSMEGENNKYGTFRRQMFPKQSRQFGILY